MPTIKERYNLHSPTVYLVEVEYADGSRNAIAVYTTQELAEKFITQQKRDAWQDYCISELELRSY